MYVLRYKPRSKNAQKRKGYTNATQPDLFSYSMKGYIELFWTAKRKLQYMNDVPPQRMRWTRLKNRRRPLARSNWTIFRKTQTVY